MRVDNCRFQSCHLAAADLFVDSLNHDLKLKGPAMSAQESQNPLLGLPLRADMLPPVSDLVGRSAELTMLRGFIDQAKATAERHRPARIVIYGEAGVGKSALGTRFADSIEDDYPDGSLYQDLNNAQLANGEVNVPQVLRRFLMALGKSSDKIPHDASDLPGEFIKATDGKRLIVFLDNVRDYAGVRDLIPRSPSCLVLLTSYERLEYRALPLPLYPLSDAAATELFRRTAPSRTTADATRGAELRELLSACEGLPIAVEVLAARLEDNPAYTLRRVLDDLNSYKSYLTGLFGAKRHAIEACFHVSYDALNEVQAMLFRRLGVVPGESFDITLGAHLGDMTIDGARLMLEELNDLRLIRPTRDPEYFTMHALWRAFTSEQLDDAEADEQLIRALTFYREQAEDADRVIRSLPPLHDTQWSGGPGSRLPRQRNPALERDRALEWMEKQYRNLVAAVKRACEENQADIAWRTCRAMVEFFEIRGKWESWEQTHKEAMEIVPGQSLGMAHLHYGLGRLNAARRTWEPAIDHYRQAIIIFRLHGEQIQVGRSLNSMGDAYRYMRNWDAAENCFIRSLEILEEAHYPRPVAIAKRSMSTIYRQRGQFREAESLCRQALATLEREEIRDERWIAATELSLADIYLDSGSQDARGLLEHCLEIFVKLKDTHWIILTRRSLGEALREDDQYAAALHQLELCQETLQRTRDDHWSGQILHSMGLVYLDQADTQKARDLFGKALKMFKDSRDTLWEGRTQVSIGRTATADGEVGKARMAYQAAWPLLVEQGAKEDLRRLEALLDRTTDKSEDRGSLWTPGTSDSETG
jgi:tetratricopeptide (TPR) repeat protein